MKTLVRSLALAAAACGVVTFSAQATMVGPGQTISYDAPDDPFTVQGTLIAQQTFTQTFTYNPEFNPDPGPPFSGQHPKLTFTAVNSVYRTADGHLTFTFDPVNEGAQGFQERYSFDTGFFSDSITTNVHSGNATVISRQTQEENEMVIANPGPNDGFAHFAIETNATEFDNHGFGSINGADEFELQTGPDSSTLVLATTGGGFNHMYEPVESAAAVPLPPAVFGGLAMLGGIVVTQIRRRRA